MEIVAYILIAGFVGWWFYRVFDNRKNQNASATVAPTVPAAEPSAMAAPPAPTRIETPAVEPAELFGRVDVKPAVEKPQQSPAARPKKITAKKPPASKAVAKPKAKKPAKK
jgi:type IV secretory pathway VirB10-like protein